MAPKRATRTGVLLFAFAFAVMAHPVSSVAFAIEAGLRALHGDLQLLIVMMAIVLASAAIGGLFAWLWVRQGRPRGIAQVEAETERELGLQED
ncbi:MAG: hypothetical protein ACXWH5_05755 [Actinomycetota bacterium]